MSYQAVTLQAVFAHLFISEDPIKIQYLSYQRAQDKNYKNDASHSENKYRYLINQTWKEVQILKSYKLTL